MDFIERIFGVSPDGGNGALEWLIVLVFMVLPICSFLFERFRRKTKVEPDRLRLTSRSPASDHTGQLDPDPHLPHHSRLRPSHAGARPQGPAISKLGQIKIFKLDE